MVADPTRDEYTFRGRVAADALLRRRIMPIPIKEGSKNPGTLLGDGWQNQRLGVDYDIEMFNSDHINIGMRLGNIVGEDGEIFTDRFADSDLDVPEVIRAAPFFLPGTGMIWGRNGKQRSHYGYRIASMEGTKGHLEWNDPLQTRSRKNPDGQKAKLAELRFNGQTIAPGSVNTQDGHPERVVWYGDGDPFEVSWVKLVIAMNWASAAGLAGRYWPEGARHEWAGPLAGMLCRGGVSLERAETFMRAIGAASKNESTEELERDRLRYVQDTYARWARGERDVAGRPSLIRAGCDEKLANTIRDWLGLTNPKDGSVDVDEDKPKRLVLLSVADLEPQRTEWLFQGYIPNGEVSALAGAGGGGKTSIAMSTCVAKAGGLPLPMGAHSDVTEPMGVIYLTSENHPNKVLRPRFEAEALRQTGGDKAATKEILSRIFIAQGVVTLPSGKPMGEDLQDVAESKEALVLPKYIDLLRAEIRARNVGLLAIDPVISFSERELDVLNPKDMRELLDPLAVLAQEENIAVWVLVHFNKSVGTTMIMRISLSRQLTDTARAVGVVLEDPSDPTRRWLSFVKGNLGLDPPSHSFYVDEVPHPNFPDALTAAVSWGDSRAGKADRLEYELAQEWEKAKAEEESKDPLSPKVLEKLERQSPVTYGAVLVLVQEMVSLKQSGADVVHSHDLEDWRVKAGFNKDPWTRARQHLHIQTVKAGNGNAPFEQRLDDPELAWLGESCRIEPNRADDEL